VALDIVLLFLAEIAEDVKQPIKAAVVEKPKDQKLVFKDKKEIGEAFKELLRVKVSLIGDIYL